MKLKTYNTKNCGQRSGGMFISLSKNGLINISAEACILLGIKANIKIELFQDEESVEDWFIGVSKSPDAFVIREKQKNGTYCIQNAFICNQIRDSLKLERTTVKFMLSKEPENGGGGKIYPIITKSGKVSNRKSK